MAITYPRALPTYEGVTAIITPRFGTAMVPHNRNKGFTAMRVGDAAWGVRVEVTPIDDDERLAWSAWLASLQGGLKTFVLYDKRRSVPFNLRDTGLNGWNGAANVSTVTSISQVSVTGIPSGVALRDGDRMALTETIGGVVRRGYTEVAEPVTSGGGTTVIPLAHPLPLDLFSGAATAQFVRPLCQFRLDGEAPEVSPLPRTTFTFTGTQQV